MLDEFDLYEVCAQAPDDLVPLLRAVHGGLAVTLGEDFCGSAAISRAWTRSISNGCAIAVDHDARPLAAARAHETDRITLVHGDVRRDTDGQAHRVDVLWVGNFSIGEWHDRDDLVAYLRHARSRLADDGVFACDVYGGDSAYLLGDIERLVALEDGRTVRYLWKQLEADPMTGMVVNAIDFQIMRDGSVERSVPDAFRYRWRLWGLPELRDAMRDAGFAITQIFPRVPDAIDDAGVAYVAPITDPDELEESFDVIVAAR